MDASRENGQAMRRPRAGADTSVGVRWWIVLRAASLASPSTREMSLETSPSTLGLLPGRCLSATQQHRTGPVRRYRARRGTVPSDLVRLDRGPRPTPPAHVETSVVRGQSRRLSSPSPRTALAPARRATSQTDRADGAALPLHPIRAPTGQQSGRSAGTNSRRASSAPSDFDRSAGPGSLPMPSRDSRTDF